MAVFLASLIDFTYNTGAKKPQLRGFLFFNLGVSAVAVERVAGGYQWCQVTLIGELAAFDFPAQTQA